MEQISLEDDYFYMYVEGPFEGYSYTYDCVWQNGTQIVCTYTISPTLQGGNQEYVLFWIENSEVFKAKNSSKSID